jgi:purine-binding chemotaxis protein CheW
MINAMEPAQQRQHGDLQIATFRAGRMLLGIDIGAVQEINRDTEATPVPHAARGVRGVMNLRGEVVTVVDLRAALGMEPIKTDRNSRNVIVNVGGELTGMCVDQVADILTLDASSIAPLPRNLDAVDRRYVLGVYPLETEILLLLNVESVLELN